LVLSPAKAGLGFLENLIPGLRSLRSHKHPTRDARVGTPLRGYYLSSLRDSLTQTSELSTQQFVYAG